MAENSLGNQRYLYGHIPSLDGWRAIAILLVILSHASASIQASMLKLGVKIDLSFLNNIGLLGVQIFFSLSGFLITTHLVNERRQTGKTSINNFYIKRFFRIIPAAILFLFVVAILAAAGQINVTFYRLISCLLFFANYSSAPASWFVGHFWSLAVEEHFYLIWPIVFILIKNPRNQLVLLITSALILALWRAVDFKYNITGSSPAVFWGRTDIQADNILLGVVSAVMLGLFGLDRMQKFDKSWLFIIFVIIFFITEIFQFFGWKLAFAMLTIRAIAISCMITITVVGGLGGGYKSLQWTFLTYIGSISYSLYLWQQLFLVRELSSAQPLSYLQIFPLNIIVAFLLAIASKKYVETRFILIGKKYVRHSLESGLVDHGQKITVAARATAEKKAVGQRS